MVMPAAPTLLDGEAGGTMLALSGISDIPGVKLALVKAPRRDGVRPLFGQPVADLDDFQKALTGLPDGAHARVRYYNLSNKKQASLGVITVDRRWFPADRCTRDDASGDWPCTALPEPPAPVEQKPATVSYPQYADATMDKLARSLVYIKFDMPYAIDGIGETHYVGAGVVVDAKAGLIVADRDTVPVSMGDVKLTFAGSLEVPGKVIYVHPQHNLAIIQYDPKLLGDTPVASAVFAPALSKPGDTVKLVGYQPDGSLTSQTTQVASLDPVLFPLSRTLRFRDTNLEALSLVNAPGNVTGVLLDKQARITSLWVSFAYDDGNRSQEVQRGIPADVVQDMVRNVKANAGLRTLDVELYPMPLSQARRLGLPDAWATKLGTAAPERREVLTVVRLTAGTPAEKALQNGDLLLAVDGKPVATFRQVEQASRHEDLTLTVLRDGKVSEIKTSTVLLGSDGTEKILMWAGALLQKPHHSAAAQRGVPGDGLLVGFYNFGSPASRYGLSAGWRIIGVNGVATPDMQSFVKAVQGLKDRDNVRLAVKNWDGTGQIITLKLDLRYWPAYEVDRTAQGWERRAL